MTAKVIYEDNGVTKSVDNLSDADAEKLYGEKVFNVPVAIYKDGNFVKVFGFSDTKDKFLKYIKDKEAEEANKPKLCVHGSPPPCPECGLFECRHGWKDPFKPCPQCYPNLKPLAKCPIHDPNPCFCQSMFFLNLNSNLRKDYTLVVDQSGSMGFELNSSNYAAAGNRRWDEVSKALKALAPHITKHDPDGVNFWTFATSSSKQLNLKTAQDVQSRFDSLSPSGGTNLAACLVEVINAHFQKGKAETVLILTDGAPNNGNSSIADRNEMEKCKNALRDAANKVANEFELSFSFIQIGCDPGASQWLYEADNDLKGAKYDIVDCITMEKMKGMSFAELVLRSLVD